MEFKGTKGKWDIYVESTNSFGVEHSNVGSKQDGVFIEVFTEEHKANALLISKAPEMLQMLQRIYERKTVTFDDLLEIKKLIKEATEI